MSPSTEADWLVTAARRLSPSGDAPVHVRPLLARFGIQLEKRLGDPKRRRGEVRKKGDDYKIVLYRKNKKERGFTDGERFTLAHELGHIILELRNGSVMPRTRREFHQIEVLCNHFADHLLMPDRVVPRLREASAQAVGIEVSRLAARCRVPLFRAACRICSANPGTAVFVGDPWKNSKQEAVIKVRWSAGGQGEGGLRIPQNAYLKASEPLGRALLAEAALGVEDARFSVPSETGPVDGFLHHAGRGLLVALVEPRRNATLEGIRDPVGSPTAPTGGLHVSYAPAPTAQSRPTYP